ncbi:hypothetical protein BIV57_03400 [Mangrovactinospora gilvigrisea]|uniref:DUF1707 domain-containing protein n=2 Tax=Mangrovactinospora gilvigrisea TaxID=1428644 RepID=A0A1J7BJF3_9ACTN|nr:DUF1707 domain-containing protein [Mangrovactinospora gilvigrisea]OIV38803.1 hypothetical protein BIV57_03400 [Mangrovactinospora gilvigrisea]
MRASDAERDRYAEILREAMAEGRLTAEEHGQRIDAVYAAKTVGELQPLVRDLPGVHGVPAPPAPSVSFDKEPRTSDDGRPPARQFSRQLVAVFSGINRKGRWNVPERVDGFMMFGGFDLDLTEAVFEHREITLNMVAVFGGADIKLPENVTVRGHGVGIFGGFDIDEHESDDPNAPVVNITGFALFGGVSAKRRKSRAKKLAERAERHAEKAALKWEKHAERWGRGGV